MKEHVRMQFLAGLITEGQYKQYLNDSNNSPLIVNMYTPIPDEGEDVGEDGFIDLGFNKYFFNFNPANQRASIGPYDEYGKETNLYSSDDENEIKSYLDSFNISYKVEEVWKNGKYITVDNVPSQNIKKVYGAEKPKFKAKPKNTKIDLKTLDFFIKRDNPEQLDKYDAGDFIGGDVYDFGGSEGPIDDSQAVIVDVFLTPKQKQNPSKFIEADLSKYVELPPKEAINIFSAVAQINSPNNLSKTIKHALKPGGLLVIKDHIGAIQNLLKYLKDFKLLIISYVDVEDSENIILSDQIYVVLKK
jgi:hypothetical protein